MHLPQRDRALLPPEPMRAHPHDQDRGAVAEDGEGHSDDVEPEAWGRVGHETLDMEELSDEDTLHGEGKGCAEVCEEGSFEGFFNCCVSWLSFLFRMMGYAYPFQYSSMVLFEKNDRLGKWTGSQDRGKMKS